MTISGINRHSCKGVMRFVVNVYTVEAGGRKRRKRHFFQHEEDAQKFINDASDAARQVGESKAFLTPQQLQDYHTATAILPEGVTLLDTVRAYLTNDHKRITAGITYGQAMEEYWDIYERLGKANSTYAAHKPGKARFLKKFGHLDAATNINNELREQHLELIAQGLAWHTVKRQRILISQFLDWAVEEGYCNENYLRRKSNVFPTEPRLQKFWLNIDQAKALLDHALENDRPMIPILALGMFAGVRPEEARSFKLEQIDWELRELHIRIAKRSAGDNNARRIIRDLPDTFWAWMQWWINESGYELDFTNWHKRFRTAIKASGFQGRSNSILRKSYGTYAIPLLKQDIVRKQLGHSTAEVTAKHYEGDVNLAEARAYFALTPDTFVATR